MRLPIDDMPLVPFPIEIKFGDVGGDRSIGERLLVREPAALLAGMGQVEIAAELASLSRDTIEFTLKPARLSQYGRPVALFLDDRPAAEATSVPERLADGSWHQRVALRLEAALETGMVVRLDDVATGVPLFTSDLSTLTLLRTVMAEARSLRERVGELEKVYERLLLQTTVLSANSRERALLDRVDLFYGLIQDRLNREFRASPTLRVPAPRGGTVADTTFGPADLEGVGFYSVEGEGGRQWRWFGPRTTLVFRDLGRTPRLLVLDFHLAPEAISRSSIRITVDGADMDFEVGQVEEKSRITVPLDAPQHDHMNLQSTIIVSFEFEYSFVPSAADQRSLSASFSSGQLRY